MTRLFVTCLIMYVLRPATLEHLFHTMVIIGLFIKVGSHFVKSGAPVLAQQLRERLEQKETILSRPYMDVEAAAFRQRRG